MNSKQTHLPTSRLCGILGDPGAVSRVDKMFVVKVNFHHERFIDATNCPWVSEDDCVGNLWYKPRRKSSSQGLLVSRPIWRRGAVSLDLPSLTESVISVAVLNRTYKNFKKGLCNIKTKIPKKSIELEEKGIHIYRGHPTKISS